MAGKFKDFGKKLGDAAKNTAKKAEESIETGKFKGKIREQENEIEKLKMQIGEAAYAMFLEGKEVFPEAAELCGSISAAKELIKEHEEKIMELRHIRICSSCGEEVEDTVAFCPKCGNKFEPKAVEEPEDEAKGNVCASCGAEIEDGVAFCPSCGAKVG
ncbi:MAG: zinc ribbon domain-containing protein [Clostridia bacterium]|nr:zinc ribbon domain-containing protein [Clostridia bacterium]